MIGQENTSENLNAWMEDPHIITGFPSLVDHALVWIFGWILPFLSGVKSRTQLQDIIFTESTRRRFYLGNSLFLCIAAAIVCLAWGLQGRSFGMLGFRAPETGTLGYAIPLALLILGSWLADFIHTYRKQSKDGTNNDDRNEFPPFLPQHFRELPAYLMLSLSAAIFEETIYRGFLVSYFLPELRGQLGWPIAAIFVPALLFSLAHYYQGWKAVGKIWVFSVGLGLLFILTGSLWPVMIIHFIIDFAGGWLAMALGRKYR
jgi:uncharacterized protein